MSINLVQKFVFETDDLVDFGEMLRTIFPVMFRKPPNPEHTNLFISDDYNMKLCLDKKAYFVCYVGDYGTDMERYKKDGAKVYDFGKDWSALNYLAMSEQICEILKTVDEAEVKKKIGSGYNSCFNRSDGSIEFGYRVEHDGGAWGGLLISMIHIYYGK